MEEPQLEKEVTVSEDEASVSKNEEVTKKPAEFEIQLVKKKDEKVKKKEDKIVEQVLKALGGVGTDEKLAGLCKKYVDVIDENKKLQVQIKQYEKKVAALIKEKNQLESEQGKLLVTRSRLESLCRELQKQNKQIKEESLNRVKEEEEKRKAVTEKFQLTLGEITHLMQQNNENNAKLRDENLELQSKFKAVCENYEIRELQVNKMSQQMKLESQLAEAELAKLKVQMLAEKQILMNEKQQLLLQLAAYKEKCQDLQKGEAALKNQIHTYTEKYDKFQGVLAKSNELYGGFKSEIEKMSKKIVKLEKETSVWKHKWESNNKILLQVTEEKQKKIAELSLASRQVTQLQKLCRVLQADRTSLLTQLKNEGFTPILSGEYTSGNDDCKIQTNDKLEENEFPELQDLENGKDENNLTDIEICELNKLKETSPETENQEKTLITGIKEPKRTNKDKPKVKTKKGKGASKNRKK